MLVVYSFFFFILGTSAVSDTISPSQSIRDGQTLVSAKGTFELGFFSLGYSTQRYLGIWYKVVSDMTVAWVANRETSVTDHSGVLSVTKQGILVLLDGTNRTIWSSNASRNATNPVVKLLESGNLVVKDGNDESQENILWQSFDHPTDTLLPGMKLGRNFATGLDKYLSSWKSAEDPAPGQFSLWIDPRGFPQLVLRNGSALQYRAGSWNGVRFTGTPKLGPNPEFVYRFELNKEEVYYEVDDQGVLMSRLFLNQTGSIQRLVRIESTQWTGDYYAPEDQCDIYSFCGVNSRCKNGSSPVCACLDGFRPKSIEEWSKSNWSKGCERMTQLNCKKGSEISKYTNLKLPDTSNSWFNTSMSLTKCKEMCLNNCSCTAYANSNVSPEGSGCLLWFGDLNDMREYNQGGQEFYIRMAKIKQDGNKYWIWVVTAVAGTFAIGILFVIFFLLMMRWRRSHVEEKFLLELMNEAKELEIEGKKGFNLKVYSVSSIMDATSCFSDENKLGEGGYGPVYLGLLDGQEIAIKRLSRSSRQGLAEFKNELIIVAKLQHTNLVRLLGFCIQGEEKMLMYEYMPNNSLDSYIFDQSKRKLFNWKKFINIIGEIAQGLLYLHKYSRLRIIHRDLKASNILLDKNMNPKISDFGMARILTTTQFEAKTSRIAGTRGYISPEYAVMGIYSTKSDVFSFGVLVLEIVSGRRRNSNFYFDRPLNLIGYAWMLWKENATLELMHPTLRDSCLKDRVLRCINVALLCVEDNPLDRPSMEDVIPMLTSEGAKLPTPKQPAFCIERRVAEVKPSSGGMSENRSINNITLSAVTGR